MTRYEYIKSASLEDIAELLCQITDNTSGEGETSEDTCGRCLAFEYCNKDHCGFVDWLQKNHSKYVWE